MRLLISGEETEAHEAPLERDDLVIGRASDSDIRLEDRDVSRRHARLSRDAHGWGVEDLGSASGTRVDGTPVTGRRRLSPGERVEIGGYALTLMLDDAELPTLPPHPAAPSGSGPATVRSRPHFRGLPVVGLVLVLAGALGWSWNARRVLAARCRSANEAWAQRDWTRAGTALHSLVADGAVCPSLDLAALAAAADTNLAASRALEEARRLLVLRDWDAALAAVSRAPAGSILSEELRQAEAEARRGQADTLAARLEAALSAGDVAEAESLLERLSRFGLDDRLLLVWRDRLSALKEATAIPPVPPAPAASPPPKAASPAVSASRRRPLADRDVEARRFYEAAGNDIRASDMLGAVDKLQRALEADPSRSLRCQVLRSLGVAYARSGKKLETARTYKAYLDCDPKAPDREQLERVVREARP